MTRDDLLQVVEPISGFSVLNKYNLPWMWLMGDGRQMSAIFSDGGGIVAQCSLSVPCATFAYKVNGSMLMKAISTLGKEGEIVLEERARKLLLKSGKTKAELPTYDPGNDIPSVEAPDGPPDALIERESMIRLVKFARALRSNICLREDGTAGCYDNHNIFSCTLPVGCKEILIPQAICGALNHLGEDVRVHAIDAEYAILSTGNVAIIYKHDRYTDYKMDKRMRAESKVNVGNMRTPKFGNFSTCGATQLLWDNKAHKVRQYNTSELMYEEDIDGDLSEYFVSSMIHELGPEMTINRVERFPVYCFDFGDVGIYASSSFHEN